MNNISTKKEFADTLRNNSEEWFAERFTDDDSAIAFYPANVIFADYPHEPIEFYEFAVTLDRVAPNFQFEEGEGGLSTEGGAWKLLKNSLSWMERETEDGPIAFADVRASLIVARWPKIFWSLRPIVEQLIRLRNRYFPQD